MGLNVLGLNSCAVQEKDTFYTGSFYVQDSPLLLVIPLRNHFFKQNLYTLISILTTIRQPFCKCQQNND